MPSLPAQKTIHYIVLGWNEPLDPPPDNRIKYARKLWDELEKTFPRRRPLALDLYTSLSALGVPPFMLKKTQTTKLRSNTKFLAQALNLLPAAQIEAGLDETPQQWDCWGGGLEGWNLGLEAVSKMSEG
jgi:hypothetical protein